MPSSAESLCTLEDVRALMQKTSRDIGQDELIESLIPAASLAAVRFTDRQFAPVQTGVIKTFEWPWEDQLVSLAPYDLTKVTKVWVDTDVGAGIELSTEEWRLFPQPPRDGTYLSIRVQPFSAALGRVGWRNRQLKIEGNWGFPEIPYDVSQAVASTVAHWVTAKLRPRDEELGLGETARGLAPDAYDLLFRFKRAMTA